MLKKTLKFIARPSSLTLVTVLAVVASVGIALFNQNIARADATSDLESGIKRYQYYNQLVNENRCNFKSEVTGKDIDIYNFYQIPFGASGSIAVGLITQPVDGRWDCGDLNATSDLSRTFAGALGLDASDPGELLCQLGYKQKVASSASTKTSCADGNTNIGGTDSFHIDNPGTEIKNYLLSHSLKNNEPKWTDAMAYWSTFQDFVKGCNAKQVSSGSYGNTVANIRTVDSAGNISMKGYSYDNSKFFVSAPGDINQNFSVGQCDVLIRGLDAASPGKYAAAYQTLLFEEACRERYPDGDSTVSACVKGAQNPSDVEYCPNTYRNITNAREACYAGQGNQGAANCVDLGFTKSSGLIACIRGSQNADNSQFCNAEYPAPDALNSSGQLANDTNKSSREACLEGQKYPAGGGIAVSGPAETQIGGGEQTSDANTCGGLIEGIGWILCPILNSVAGLNDAMWGFTSALLTVSPIQQSDGGNYIPQYGGSYTPTYAVWQAFRNIANVALVIVFLIMIFSQLTSSGISNYGIKKTLPRLIIAAIAINASFFIIQITVDVFNILGKGIYDIIDNLVPVVQPTWDALIGLVLGGGLTIAGIVGTVAIAPQWAIMLIIGPAVAGLIALLAAMLTLLFRQAVIPILAVLAPLAFVAYLLPNTKPWFDKWKNLLISMLMLFPLAALLFGGVKLAAAIVMGENSAWGTFAALIILTIPLFMLPFIARQTGPMLGKIHSAIKGAGDKLVGKPVGAWADRRKALSLAKSDASAPSRYNVLKRARQGLARGRKKTELLSEAYKAQAGANYNSELAEGKAEALAGAVSGSAAKAYIRGAGSRAEAEEMKLAQVPLQDELAKVRAAKGNTDTFLEDRAVSTSHSAAERAAALQELAATGRDGALRRLQTRMGTDQEKAALERAISANAGALASKAPDLIKPLDKAFDNVTGEQLAGFTDGTAEKHVEYLKDLYAKASAPNASQQEKDKFNLAATSFFGAVADIQNTPALQAKFGGEVGRKIRESFAGGPSGFERYLPPSIKDDGKIR